MTLLLELLRWWGLATGSLLVLLVLVVAVQSAKDGLARRSARQPHARRKVVPSAVIWSIYR